MADPACPAVLMHGQTLVEAIWWPRPDDDREHVCFRAAGARARALAIRKDALRFCYLSSGLRRGLDGAVVEQILAV